MTATIEARDLAVSFAANRLAAELGEARPAVVMVTADGEAREAKTWPDGSWSCNFCDTPVISPDGHEERERSNAAIYAKTGEEYTRQPYADYMRRQWEARTCPNPACVANLGSEALARVREDQRRKQEREARDAAEKAREQAKKDAAEARKTRAAEIHSAVADMGRQLGFAWCCTHTEPAASSYSEPDMCEASGWDRGEYDAHMRGHGAKVSHGAVKPMRLRRKPPAASLPKLPCSPFKFITWEQSITVHDEMGRPDHTETATRRGQFWAVGPDAHSVWVLPYELAPWESGHAAPVLLYVGAPGRFHASAYSAKYDRR